MPFTKDSKRRELTTPEHARSIEAGNRGATWCEIEKDFPVTAQEAKKVFDRWMETKSLRRTKHKGRPGKLSKSDEQYLHQIVIRFPQATLAEIRKHSRLNVSERTISIILRNMQVYVHVARRKPYLKRSSMQRRRQFAYRYQFMESQWWRKHVYTDEVYVATPPRRHMRTYIRRPPGTANQTRYLAPTFYKDSETIGFWTAFSSIGHSELVPLPIRTIKKRDGTTSTTTVPDSKTYIHHILIPHLVPLYYVLGGTGEGCMTIEYGASYHRSADTSWLRKMLGVERLDWPAHWPDLNPIEKIWPLWKRQFRRACQDPNKRPHTRDETIALVRHTWEGLPWPQIYKWVDKMPRRIDKLRQAHDGSTKY